jgi:hypothetical protein
MEFKPEGPKRIGSQNNHRPCILWPALLASDLIEMPNEKSHPPQHSVVLRRCVWGVGILAMLFLPVAFYFVNAYWPFRYRIVEPTLEKVFASKIKMDHYHRTYFPYPGFVANGLTLRRNSAPDLPPVGSVDRVRVEGSWIDLLLLRNRIRAVYADGLHVVIPPVGSRANLEDFPPGSSHDFEGPSTAVERFIVKDGILDILRVGGGSYTFPIHRLVITNLQKNKAIGYTVEMQTPNASGRILSSGSFGPLVGGKLQDTAARGTFTYNQVKLDGLTSLHGTLLSSGSFQGNLAAIEVLAKTQVTDFAVGKGRGVALSGASSGAVDALNGDIILHSVDITTGKTVVHVSGQLVGGPKVTDLDVSIAKGRVQDILQPFMNSASPVVGPVRLHSHAHIAGARQGKAFLDRLSMSGAFEIPSEKLTNPSTEKSLTAFSERAQGVPGDTAASVAEESDVLSSVAGPVTIAKGVLHTPQLLFNVPGALIDANGTFNLRDQTVDMMGTLTMQADISHVTTGFKSYLLKPVAPFFKKKNAGAVVPIRVTGKPGQYKVGPNIPARK